MDRNQGEAVGKRQEAKWAGWKESPAVRWLLLALFVVLIYGSLAPHIIPETYNIQEGQASEKDILAPFQITDEKATRAAEEAAAAGVDTKYSNIQLRSEALITQIFTRIRQINGDSEVTTDNKVEIYRYEIPKRYQEHIDSFVKVNKGKGVHSESLLDEMVRVAKEQEYTIPEETFYKIPNLKSEYLDEMQMVATDIVRKLMVGQVGDAESVRTQVAELVNASALSDRTSREIVQELARFAIMPNRFLDVDATEQAKITARENTPSVAIKEGDVLVAKNQVITPDIYALLQSASLLQDKQSYWPQIGLLLISIIFVVSLYAYLHQSGSINSLRPKYSNVQLLLLWLIYVANLLIMEIVSLMQSKDFPYVGFLAPVALGAMLITLLLDSHLALFSSMLFAVAGSAILSISGGPVKNFDFQFGFYILVMSVAAIFSIHRASQRSSILKAGIMVSIFGTLSVSSLIFITEQFEQMSFIYSVGAAFFSGLLTSVLVLGLMPFFEVTFGILSPLKLVELSNPNHPLLRKLLTETPGTYHHSVMVGNLAEAAAESIGADGLLCRVGSYYHDIGKTKRPSYFIENQTNMENPHDSIAPELSKAIIVAHAKEGAEMLKAHNMPKQIRDIAEQHHGTTSLKYFYHKAVKLAEAEGITPEFTEEDFRYPGPKAQSKEAAVVGLSDCVEAAVRSLRNPTVEQVESMINKIIKGRLEDNQFNECDLTLKELDRIAQSLKESVVGIFHSRIEYPEDVKVKESEKNGAGASV